jgi:hypothetical protein
MDIILSTNDVDAQDLLATYAQRRRALEPELANRLEADLKAAGYKSKAVAPISPPPKPTDT